MTTKKRKSNITLLFILLIVSTIMTIIGSFGVSYDSGFISLIILGGWGFAFTLVGLVILVAGD